MMKKDDSKTLWTAQVDPSRVSYVKRNLGIDFANEIDAWTRMEYHFSRQIQSLKNTGKLGRSTYSKSVKNYVYAVREKVEI